MIILLIFIIFKTTQTPQNRRQYICRILQKKPTISDTLHRTHNIYPLNLKKAVNSTLTLQKSVVPDPMHQVFAPQEHTLRSLEALFIKPLITQAMRCQRLSRKVKKMAKI